MLTDYKVSGIEYPTAKYIFGKAVPIYDEGGHYRINDSHIFDKFRIREVVTKDDHIVLKMQNEDVVLSVTDAD